MVPACGPFARDFPIFFSGVRSRPVCGLRVRFPFSRSTIGREVRVKQLNRNDAATWSKLCESLKEKRADISAAQEEFSEELGLLRTDLDSAWDTLQEAVGAYQDAAEEAARWVGEVVAAAEDWRSERGARWRKSEVGQLHVAWCESMQEVQARLELCVEHEDRVPVIEDYKAEVPEAPAVGSLLSGISEVKT